jgi:hypothetical protein
MGVYKNDYNKNEDVMMYELHEIRNKLSKENKNINQINVKGKDVIKKYNLNNLKISNKIAAKDKILMR